MALYRIFQIFHQTKDLGMPAVVAVLSLLLSSWSCLYNNSTHFYIPEASNFRGKTP
jgi:hypothetical protein